MKWLIWSNPIRRVLAAAAVPGGIVWFALPLPALGHAVFGSIAIVGSAEHDAALRSRAEREQHSATAVSSATGPEHAVAAAPKRGRDSTRVSSTTPARRAA